MIIERQCLQTYFLGNSTPTENTDKAIQTRIISSVISFVVLFIAGGLAVARMLTDPNWAMYRYIDFDHELVGEERPINN